MARHLHGRPETRDKDRDIREGPRNRGYEVVEIQFGQLTDPDAMRLHFFRIGRFLLGKDAAQRIRDDSSWYTSSQTLSDTPPKGDWTEVLGLLDSPWRPLAQGLRLAGLRSPDEVDWDWIESGKVSGKRALMMWSTKTGQALLVDAGSGIGPGPNIVAAEPASTQAAVVALLSPLLEEAQ